MKKNLLFITSVLLVISFAMKAQPGDYDFLNKISIHEKGESDPLKVVEYKLANGLTVYLNEDHNLSKVFGAVVVKGGAKCDPEGHPGIAHYFEHIMFKGTDELGTTDYKTEKVYLDSITVLYDKLGETKDELERKNIQSEINRISVKAADYAIPNEMDKVLEGMGSTGVNAFTSKDAIVYHNSFPGNQVEKWIEVYSHRFMHPVYRLFQSELETVYEEKNMYMDNPFTKMIELYEGNLYKGHPYGNSIIGEVDNLKNPSLSAMDKFFQTYYVANNMGLLLTGDFNTEDVIPMIEAKFGRWRSGDVPAFPDYKIEQIVGKNVISKRLTPVKVGVIGFPAIPLGHEDEVALEVCNSVLSNSSSTGLLDKLMIDNEILAAMPQQMAYTKEGSIMLLYVPKLIGQSFSKAEALVFNKLDLLKKGEFSDDLFNAVKMELEVQYLQSLESGYNRAFILMDAFLLGKTWEEMLADADKLKNITKDDVVAVANKYYGENYLSLQSKTGFPKKEKIDKPGYEAVDPENSEQESDYLKKIKAMPVINSAPDFVEFGKDVMFEDIDENLHFFYTPNPVNEVFNLRIQFGVGDKVIPNLEFANEHLSLLGTESMTLEEFKGNLQAIGSSFYVGSSSSYFTVYITGLDKNFDETILLANKFLKNVKADDEKMDLVVESVKVNRKMEPKDPSTQASALKEFVQYGEKSSFIDRTPLKEIKDIKSIDIVNAFKEAMQFEAEAHYSGRLPYSKVKDALITKLLVEKPTKKSNSPFYMESNPVSKNVVYFINDKKAVQSQIHLIVEGEVNDTKERIEARAFNKYYSSDMSSVVFQEIREYRSLAYSAYAYHSSPYYEDKKGYTYGFMSTQADKTIEALEIFTSLMKDMPRKPDRIHDIRTSLVQSIRTDKPGFRNMSNSVSYWLKKGYTEDARKQYLEIFNIIEFEDLDAFYKKNIEGRPIAIVVVGDKKRIDFKELEKFGEIIELKTKNVFTK